MRTHVDLYIAGKKADLADDGLILYNYAFTDVEKPTAVKNSFSKQITLPGTPVNDAIFGHYARVDHAVGSAGFNPLERTPFVIYGDTGEVLERGYLRLDSVARTGRGPASYKVSLFGGLGAFFYALAYRSDGTKRTLADMDYDGLDLDFTINADAVRSAWASLGTETGSKWDVINFAPCYNGAPDGDFSADKAVFQPGDFGLDATKITEDGTFRTLNGYALLNLTEARDEWAVKDMRSYLQRPVFSMRAFMRAICDDQNNGGHAVDISDIPVSQYKDLWKTLPLIPSLGGFKKVESDIALVYQQAQQSGRTVAEVTTATAIPQGAETSARMTCSFRWSDGEQQTPSFYVSTGGYRYYAVFFIQAVAYSGDVVVGASPAKAFCKNTSWDADSLAEAVGFTPVAEAGTEPVQDITASRDSLGIITMDGEYTFTVSGIQPTRYAILIRSYYVRTAESGGQEGIQQVIERTGFFCFLGPVVYSEADWQDLASFSGTLHATTASKARSGAYIAKEYLLSSAGTPADYLLGLARTFGWVFSYDKVTGTVSIMPRSDFFGSGEDVDLTDRVDTAKGITVLPLYAASKWYEMAPDVVEGAFAKEYALTYGQGYAIQRVNTGYAFDAKAVNLLDGYPFKGAATVLESSPYFNTITTGGAFRPSVFVDKGNTYTLWLSDGSKSQEFQVSCPPLSAAVAYFNDDAHGYDFAGADKAQFHDADGKGVDGEDVLLYFRTRQTYPHFSLTDDLAIMPTINDEPCWILQPSANGLSLPVFSRLRIGTDGNGNPLALDSLDFGIPKETGIPGLRYDTKASRYARAWKAYLSDLLDKDTKVMRCRVRFDGLPVGPGLLRRFYWYEGSLWVLNKISNCSLTTPDPVECEFIQVQDTDHYTDGIMM